MRKIILTIGIKSSFIEDDTDAKKIDIREILALYPEVLKTPINSKPIAILKYINDHKGNLLIGSAINKLSDYIELKKGLHFHCSEITRVIVKFPDSSIENYEKQYKQHARWLDYSPDAAKNITNDYIKELNLLAQLLEKDGINVEIVS